VEDDWVERVRKGLPELPRAKFQRFKSQYELKDYDANLLVGEQGLADYFEQTLAARPGLAPKVAANWILGDLFSLLNQNNTNIADCPVSPARLAELISLVVDDKINGPTAKNTLTEMYTTGQSASAITASRGSEQISDNDTVAALVARVLAENPTEVERFQAGKDTLAQWFFGQVMKAAKGQANPKVLRSELERQLAALRSDLAESSDSSDLPDL
jgi:aspartyl-tRNA(Asn)/glutamyl-tRNA(Gln) amidotransferase subunit B